MVEFNYNTLGFEISDGHFNFIVVEVHADTLEVFDSEGCRDLEMHEEWHEAVQEMLKDGGALVTDPLAERLASWVEFHPAFPIANFNNRK